MRRWLVDKLIARAMRTPYRKGHIYGPDGSLYMRRYALFETKWLSARIHHLAREDRDRALHDHPWTFVSIVLRGGYVEKRPANTEPCFVRRINGDDFEAGLLTQRLAGSIACRCATDRHAITEVMPNTWSLFIYGPVRQWWGFYTPQGKIHSRDYESARARHAQEVREHMASNVDKSEPEGRD